MALARHGTGVAWHWRGMALARQACAAMEALIANRTAEFDLTCAGQVRP
jgi:hypothetical protein